MPSFHLSEEYVNQFTRDRALFTSIEEHLQELSDSRYIIHNPKTASLEADNGKIPFRGIVPAQRIITDIVSLDNVSPTGLEYSRVMFHYDDLCISEFIDIPEWDIALDTHSFSELHNLYANENITGFFRWVLNYQGNQFNSRTKKCR